MSTKSTYLPKKKSTSTMPNILVIFGHSRGRPTALKAAILHFEMLLIALPAAIYQYHSTTAHNILYLFTCTNNIYFRTLLYTHHWQPCHNLHFTNIKCPNSQINQ